jgi:Xaa-Pro aminopeptidase
MSEESKPVSRAHDESSSDQFAEFMRSGWANSELSELQPLEVTTYAFARRQVLSRAFPDIRLVLPAGNFKVRSNDTDYAFRPHNAFAYYSGVQGADATADSVLVMEPNTSGGHDTTLYIHPRSTRESDAFYKDSRYGELWVGRRFTLAEASMVYQLEVRRIEELESLLRFSKETLIVRGCDAYVDRTISMHPREAEFATYLSEQRLIKDSYELGEMQRAVDATALGFNDVITALPAAVESNRGERIIESAFFGRARLEGNDLGYNTIAASGSHACVLHWIRNDGKVKDGDLILIDAGVEMDSYYTADITRTLPVNGKFNPVQRSLYMLVYEAQLAGFAAVKPGALFSDVNRAAQEVLANGLRELGVLQGDFESGNHKRWTLHGVSHFLGMDVHDCAQARKENYLDGVLAEGMVLTVEPGLYIQPDDELFPEHYRGIGIRIEDDVVVTADGYKNLSQKLPRHPDEIEEWMRRLLS